MSHETNTVPTATDKHGRTQKRSVSICVVLWLVCLGSSVALEAQWPQWRGPGGLGISPGYTLRQDAEVSMYMSTPVLADGVL